MQFIKSENLAGDFWGGLAAMLVALPSAIAFGVTIYSPLGSSYAAMGTLAGIEDRKSNRTTPSIAS
ncbi:MAG: hypothetical protein IPH35_22345 [Rhodoferax sp.]|nr:hypothetical protein [Rhodoferax sp.]